MDFFFRPQGITVIGATPNRHKGGNAIVRNLAFVGRLRMSGFHKWCPTFHQRNVEITRHHTIDYNEVYSCSMIKIKIQQIEGGYNE